MLLLSEEVEKAVSDYVLDLTQRVSNISIRISNLLIMKIEDYHYGFVLKVNILNFKK